MLLMVDGGRFRHLPRLPILDLRWYIVHAYSGMEKAVERNIVERIGRAGMQDKFGRVLVPHRRGGGDEKRPEENN